MKPSSKKNINPVLSDVKHLRASSTGSAPPRHGAKDFLKPKTREPLLIKSGHGYWKKTLLLISLAVIILTALFGWYLWNFKNNALISSSSIYENLKSAAWSVVNLENDSADSSLMAAQKELVDLQDRASIFGLFPILKEIPKTIFQVRDLTVRLKNINDGIDRIKVEGFKMFFGGEGKSLVNLLKSLKTDVVAVDNTVSDLRNKASRFGALPVDVSDDYLVLNVGADKLVSGLDAFISLLEKPGSTHFVMIFENPSEIRPGGGFVGSYADVVLENGGIKTIDVDDIYHPDRFLDLKIIPPKQLQGVTSDWGARDANWFFNFPDSAKKIMKFIEASSLYEEQGVTFDGVIALNVRVMEDILKIVGPVEIPEYDLVLDDKNFLSEVQLEVETGRDKKPGQNPKKVLKFILPKVLESLSGLDNSRKKLFIDTLSYRLANKDIRFYFEDERMQNIVAGSGLGGEVYETPLSSRVDYLAVVNTNVAGGKTDAFMAQKIELVSKIMGDGVVNNNLTISRIHSGQNEKNSWYRQTNQNFIKVFTPLGSNLTALTGSMPKTVKPIIVNYAKSGYTVDEDLKTLEDTEEFIKDFNAYAYKESGKTVFGAWFNIKAGETKQLSLTYSLEKKIDLRPGQHFQFVFDKQSGVESQFDYILEAPTGFKWRESNDFIYHYKSDTIPSRLVINLTLEKM